MHTHTMSSLGEPLQLGLAAEQDVALRRRRVVGVVRTVVLHLVDDRRVRALRVTTRHAERLVRRDAGLDLGVEEHLTAALGVLGVVADDHRPVQVVLVLLQQVLRLELVAVVRLGDCDPSCCTRAAPGLTGNATGEQACGTPVATLARSGMPGHGTRLVDAVDLVVDVAQEQHEGPDHRVVVLARGDDRVAGLVGVQVRVDEVDDELAAGDTASAGLAVEVLRRALHTVDGALEQSGGERVVDVGDHRDADLLRRDPDLGRLRRLAARLRGHRGRPQRHQSDHGRQATTSVCRILTMTPPRRDRSPRSAPTVSTCRGSRSSPGRRAGSAAPPPISSARPSVLVAGLRPGR